MISDTLKPGVYLHFKGGKVRVLHVATHSETLEKFVVYRCLYECRTNGKCSIWIRPLKMFKENVMINGKRTPRFKFMKE
ncbi:MAG: DUF1653 domain-containing protein [Candidatus Aenigmarchaeota archaeon]|nr:DUF1653 domain-containing protein [Candidatus Aenigmarchaeota archaeon]